MSTIAPHTQMTITPESARHDERVPGPVDALVFDIGGVVLDWDPRHLYRALLPDEAAVEHFLGTVCTLEWHWPHDAGRPMAESIPELCSRHPEHAPLIRAWQERYLDMVGGTVDGMDALLADLEARRVPLYALSNMPAEVIDGLREKFPILGHFHGIVVSGVEQVVKPDRAIFDLLVSRYGLDPSTTLFVDDRDDNVDGALRAGWQAVRFESVPQLRAELTRAGLLI